LLCPLLLSITRPPPVAAPVPYTTLFRSANGETRREAVHDLLFGRGQVARGLEEAFKVRYYTFGKDAARTDSLTAAGANGRETNVAAALKRVLADFNGVPLAGLVLMTDGADNSQEVD